ncbi:hypothetical protein FPSM_01818 [Flavobacterium psychrophilum]|nr:hypothetical protein FPSM_01818 [Flavobacterium psychrophilum]
MMKFIKTMCLLVKNKVKLQSKNFKYSILLDFKRGKLGFSIQN